MKWKKSLRTVTRFRRRKSGKHWIIERMTVVRETIKNSKSLQQGGLVGAILLAGLFAPGFVDADELSQTGIESSQTQVLEQVVEPVVVEVISQNGHALTSSLESTEQTATNIVSTVEAMPDSINYLESSSEVLVDSELAVKETIDDSLTASLSTVSSSEVTESLSQDSLDSISFDQTSTDKSSVKLTYPYYDIETGFTYLSDTVWQRVNYYTSINVFEKVSYMQIIRYSLLNDQIEVTKEESIIARFPVNQQFPEENPLEGTYEVVNQSSKDTLGNSIFDSQSQSDSVSSRPQFSTVETSASSETSLSGSPIKEYSSQNLTSVSQSQSEIGSSTHQFSTVETSASSETSLSGSPIKEYSSQNLTSVSQSQSDSGYSRPQFSTVEMSEIVINSDTSLSQSVDDSLSLVDFQVTDLSSLLSTHDSQSGLFQVSVTDLDFQNVPSLSISESQMIDDVTSETLKEGSQREKDLVFQSNSSPFVQSESLSEEQTMSSHSSQKVEDTDTSETSMNHIFPTPVPPLSLDLESQSGVSEIYQGSPFDSVITSEISFSLVEESSEIKDQEILVSRPISLSDVTSIATVVSGNIISETAKTFDLESSLVPEQGAIISEDISDNKQFSLPFQEQSQISEVLVQNDTVASIATMSGLFSPTLALSDQSLPVTSVLELTPIETALSLQNNSLTASLSSDDSSSIRTETFKQAIQSVVELDLASLLSIPSSSNQDQSKDDDSFLNILELTREEFKERFGYDFILEEKNVKKESSYSQLSQNSKAVGSFSSSLLIGMVTASLLSLGLSKILDQHNRPLL